MSSLAIPLPHLLHCRRSAAPSLPLPTPRSHISSSSVAAIGTSSPFPDDADLDLYDDRGEAIPSTSVTSVAGCGCHVLRAPKEGRRARFLPNSKAPLRRLLSFPEGGRYPQHRGSWASNEGGLRKIEFGSLLCDCSSCRQRITDRDAVFMYGDV